MFTRIPAAVIVLACSAGLAGCSSSTPSTPTPSTPPSTQTFSPLPPEYSIAQGTLYGLVTEDSPSGPVPIRGAVVANGEGLFTETDDNGYYSLYRVWVCPCRHTPLVPANTTVLWIGKAGYGDPEGQPRSIFQDAPDPDYSWRDVTVVGDTRFDVRLVAR